MSGAGQRLELTWKAPGPIAAAFMRDRSDVSIINGPVGSAKTTTALMKMLRIATEQKPSLTLTAPGPRGERLPMRRFRLAVVRDTYRQLWRTTLPSWFARVPRGVGDFSGGEGAPATHRVPFSLPDGTMVEFQADFVAIGDLSAEDALRGYEVSAFYLNELDLCAAEVFHYARTRTGRFPPRSDGGATWHGIVADLNAPELHNWTYSEFFLQTQEELAAQGMVLFRQPSGLSPVAENLQNLPENYYAKMARGAPEWLTKRMIENVPGYSRAGKPVYPEFHDATHVAAGELAALPGIPLGIGLDAGGHPAAVLGQRLPSGIWRIVDELTGEAGTGARRFGGMLAKLLADRYAGFDCYGWADPSAAYGADVQVDEQTWIDIVAAETGLRIRPAPTNKPTARWEAVRLPLTRLIDGKPGFQLSPRCKMLRAGFAAEYRFRKIQGTADRYDESAEKNGSSHPHDALQYLCSGGGEDREIRKRRADDRTSHQQLAPQAPAWNPYGVPA